MLSLVAAAATVWWLDVFIDAREIAVPDWRPRLETLLSEASALYSVQDHPLDYACPVELRAWSISVYQPGIAGYVEGGSGAPHREMSLTFPFPRTRLYVAPGPGWAVGSGAQNWAYTWIGLWQAYPGTGGALLDPWGRPSRQWAVAHELGHAARLSHRTVTREEDCSLMAYDSMLQGVQCPLNGMRLTQADCTEILRRAREQPAPGNGQVHWLVPPQAPVIEP
jgi:hypothetical protein